MIRLPFGPRPRFVGSLDGLVDRHVSGWVVDTRHPRRRVLVSYSRSGAPERLEAADLYRADVQKAGHSEDGYCGFRIPYLGAGLRLRLSPEHRTVAFDPAAQPARRERVRRGGCLFVVAWRPGRAWGYALNGDDPTERRRLTSIGRDGSRRDHVASLFDRDAALEPGSDGFHGFRLLFTSDAARLEDAATGFPIKVW